MALIKCMECGKEKSTEAETCPHCGLSKTAKAKGKPSDSFAPLIILFSLLFGTFVFTYYGTSNPKTNESPAQSTADSESANQAEFETTAQELALAYAKNSVSADAKFKGHRYSVSGIVSDINTDIENHAVIVLIGGSNPFILPQFQINDDYKNIAANVKQGQSITLICTGYGDILKSPLSKDCVF
jgi:DNA-directed RNA polymerase subunit RPC12/RpoP